MSYLFFGLRFGFSDRARRPEPPTKAPLAALAINDCGMALHSIPTVQQRNLALARRTAHHKGQSVEDFRAWQIRRIDRYWNPYRGIFARRYLETECESVSL